MATFDMEEFAVRLLAESLFFDEEFGVLGNLSLIDTLQAKEHYVATFLPEDGSFVIERATGWESDDEVDEDDAIGYALAVESADHGSYESAEECARALLLLAKEDGFLPSVTLYFEDDQNV